MPEDHGEAIKTSDFLGDTAEDIVIAAPLDPPSERKKRGAFHWGGGFAIQDGPW